MKLLKCMGFSVVITVFIANIFMVFVLTESCIQHNAIRELKDYSDTTGEPVTALTEVSTSMEKLLEDAQDNNPNSQYSIVGLTLYQLTSYWTCEIVGIILGSILVGIILGTIVYMITEKKYTGGKLLIKLAIALLIICLICSIIIFIYNYIISCLVNAEINGNHILQTLNYSILIFITIFFLACAIVIYIFNYIYQKAIAKKLNNELHKNS